MPETSGSQETNLEDTPVRLERRAFERYPCRRSPFVRVIARPNFQAHRAFLQDVSLEGIGLILDRPFDIGTLLAVQLRSTHTGVSGILTAKVIHATQQGDGSWLVGCTLNRRLTDDEICHLL